jgi:photoactive yellow protein
MSEETREQAIPFGLLELDPAGAIRHYEPESGLITPAPAEDMLGRNFFADIAAVSESEEFRAHINKFRVSAGPAGSFSFTFVRGLGGLRVRVLLARVPRGAAPGGVESLLVHIRPEAAAGTAAH